MRGSAGAGGFQDARDGGGPHERPGGVVHRDPADVRAQRREPRPHRVLALGAAEHRRGELRDGGELGREALPALEVGPGDHGHHPVDRRRRRHRGEGVQQQRPARQRDEGLGSPLSEALAAARSQHESRDAHGRRE